MQTHLRRTFKRSSMPIPDTCGEEVKVKPKVLIAQASSTWLQSDQVCRFHARLLGICGVALVVGLVVISCSTPQKNWTSSGGPSLQPDQTGISESCGRTGMASQPSPTLPQVQVVSWWGTFKDRCLETYRHYVGSPSVNLKEGEIISLPFSTSGPTEIKLGSPPMWTSK